MEGYIEPCTDYILKLSLDGLSERDPVDVLKCDAAPEIEGPNLLDLIEKPNTKCQETLPI
jgi:hypothetical protein